MKTCTQCQTQKPLSEFYPNKRLAFGVSNLCKPCDLAKSKAYRAKHHDRLNANTAAWVTENREQKNAQDRDRYHNKVKATPELQAKHRESGRIAQAKVRSTPEGRAKVNAQGRKSKRNNLHKGRANQARRKARKLLAPAVPDCPEVVKIYELAQRLSVNGLEFHVDHIMPLSKGGAHIWQNMQVILASANLHKGASC